MRRAYPLASCFHSEGNMSAAGATGGSDAANSGKVGDSIILEEEIDPNYEPSEDEVIE